MIPRLLLHLALLATLALSSARAAAPIGLPAPTGPYPVGVRAFLIVGGTHGPIPALVWYPAAKPGPARPYLTHDQAGLAAPSLAASFGFDPAAVAALDRLPAHDTEDALPATGRFPLVLFGHGLLLYPEQNTALLDDLASHGYVVVSIAHPGDAVDLQLPDGRVVATRRDRSRDLPLAAPFHILVGDSPPDQVAAALVRYRQLYPATDLAGVLARWRDDTLATVRDLQSRTVPGPIRAVLAHTDATRLVVAGMSLGGATAATVCPLVAACRAAINLDGQAFDPAAFDRPIGRPLLLVQSDWTRFALFPGQSTSADFSPDDYAWQRWRNTGRESTVVRDRILGVKHLGLTDLPFLGLASDPAKFGIADPVSVSNAIEQACLAFLDRWLKNDAHASSNVANIVNHDTARVRDEATAFGRIWSQ